MKIRLLQAAVDATRSLNWIATGRYGTPEWAHPLQIRLKAAILDAAYTPPEQWIPYGTWSWCDVKKWVQYRIGIRGRLSKKQAAEDTGIIQRLHRQYPWE